MPNFTNTTKGSLDFVVGGTPDKPEFASFKPGQSRDDVSLNFKHPAVIGALTTGALVTDEDTLDKALGEQPGEQKTTSKRGAKAESLPAVS